jgi:hypothetical protein
MANTAFKQVKNHAQSTLASSITNSGTSISLPSGEGARFPQPGNGFYAWIWDQETYPDPYDDADREVVLVTARSTDTLTVTRAQKSTSGVAHNSGEAIRLMTDADLIDEIKAAINDLERPVDVVRWHDDFPVHGNSTTSLLTDVPWAVYGTSVAAIAANASNRMGIAGFYARFNASEYSGAHRGVSSIRLGDAAITIEAAVYIPTLATAGEDYTFRIGLGDASSNADHTDGVYFEYNRADSANWRICTASNSTRTKTNTSTAVVDAAWVTLKIVINAAANSVEFFVDGTSVGTITTNIPTGSGRETGPNIHNLHVAGTAYNYVYVDWYDFEANFTTAR